MHKLTLTKRVFLLSFFVVLISCSGNNKKEADENLQMEASFFEVSIEGMTCLGCEQTIQNNVSKLDGIKSVKASFTEGNALIEYFPAKVDSGKIKEAVTRSGYSVKRFIVPQQ